VEYRNEHGPFESVEDLAKIRGIGVEKLEKIREKAEL
jgi:competence ComEA-like helix-hairpin-helix protein